MMIVTRMKAASTAVPAAYAAAGPGAAVRRGAPWRLWVFAFVCWTAAGFFFGSHTILAYKPSPGLTSGRLMLLSLIEYYLWGLLSIPILWLARTFRFRRNRWGRVLAAHALLSVLFSLLHLVLYTKIVLLVVDSSHAHLSAAMLRSLAVMEYHLDIPTYWVLIGISHGIDWYRQACDATLLRAQLAESRLKVLQIQLHPHFLFNTMHAISALMHRDVEAADEMIARLSDLLRMSLNREDVQEVPLREELELLEHYLSIEKVRFADRLDVAFEIDSAARDELVPNLILQPIVENSIRYAIAPRISGGRIVVRAVHGADGLCIEVEDDGPGLAPEWREGVGLSNVRSRLAELYGTRQSLRLIGAPGGGLVVRLQLARGDVA